ncbi:N-6 DNA methylase [Thermosynechococcus sp. HN-54]|nr:N-6 DNA methylase [Thermosynechococcus sp. HN-54]
MEKTVKSKRRVQDHGEVVTPQHIVGAMLDLVKLETERIDSRFLEPACGTGNFLVEILARKLRVVEARYAKVQLEYERYAVLAVSSLYGIDILENNVQECGEVLALPRIVKQMLDLFPPSLSSDLKGFFLDSVLQKRRFLTRNHLAAGSRR